jgi:hypothetical protein
MRRFFLLGLALTLTTPPVPGQASEHAAKPTGDVERNSTRQQNPSVTTPTANSETGQTNNRAANKPAKNDKPYSVRVTALPPKDWTDWVAWIAGIVLAGIGGAGVYFAIRTVRGIEKQWKMMKRQANLMERQANLMELPYLTWVDYGQWDSACWFDEDADQYHGENIVGSSSHSC